MNEIINFGDGKTAKVILLKGEQGNYIASITKTGTQGLVDTYTITMTNGDTSTFTVTNGSSIQSVTKTGTQGLVDTYTITLTNGQVGGTFTVTNANGMVDEALSTTSTNAVQNKVITDKLYEVCNQKSFSDNTKTIEKVMALWADAFKKTNNQFNVYGQIQCNTGYYFFQVDMLYSSGEIEGCTIKPYQSKKLYSCYRLMSQDAVVTELAPKYLVDQVASDHRYQNSSENLETAIGNWCDTHKTTYTQYNVTGSIQYNQGWATINVDVLTSGGVASGGKAMVDQNTKIYSFYRPNGSNAVLTELAPKSALDSYIKTVEITVTPNTTQSVKSCLDSAIRYFYDNYYENGKVFYVIIHTLPVAENWYPLLYMQIHCGKNALQRATINGAGYALDGYCYGIRSTIYDGNYLIGIWKNGQEMEE